MIQHRGDRQRLRRSWNRFLRVLRGAQAAQCLAPPCCHAGRGCRRRDRRRFDGALGFAIGPPPQGWPPRAELASLRHWDRRRMLMAWPTTARSCWFVCFQGWRVPESTRCGGRPTSTRRRKSPRCPARARLRSSTGRFTDKRPGAGRWRRLMPRPSSSPSLRARPPHPIFERPKHQLQGSPQRRNRRLHCRGVDRRPAWIYHRGGVGRRFLRLRSAGK